MSAESQYQGSDEAERVLRPSPASEAWLFDNPPALASVKQGLRESAEGKRIYRGSFAKHATE